MIETDIQRAILEFLQYKGIFCWRNNSGALQDKNGRLVRFGKVGSSDIMGILPDGKFLAIEVKGPKGKLSDHQKEFLDGISKNNGVAIVARSVEEVEQDLKHVL